MLRAPQSKATPRRPSPQPRLTSDTINQRVQQIKHKYRASCDMHVSLFDYSSVDTGKENCSTFLNTSLELSAIVKRKGREGKAGQAGNTGGQAGNKTGQAGNKGRIKELQEVNKKIEGIIASLKVECHDDTAVSEQLMKRQAQQVSEISQYLIDGQRERDRIARVSHRFRSLQSSLKHSSTRKNRQNGKIVTHKSLNKRQASMVLDHAYILEDDHSDFCRKIAAQIDLDEAFLKEKTKLIKTGKEKGKLLLRQALQKTILDQELLMQVLEVNLEQIDPLYTERAASGASHEDLNQVVYNVVDKFLKCQDHLTRKIKNKFTRNALRLKELDLEGKGHFVKQDLTRYLSIICKKMLFNRSTSLLYRRINQRRGKIVSVPELINFLCY